MTLVRHIFAKDLRLLCWILVAWIALLVIDTIDRVLAPRLMAFDQRWLFVLSVWLLLVSAAYGLVLIVFIANHIQAERLVGTTAFWLTRPIPRDTLLRSKLLGLFVFIVLPMLAIEAILMTAFQVPVTALVVALIQQVWTVTILLLVLTFGATLTATATRMLFLAIGTLLVVYFAFLTWMSLLFANSTNEPSSSPPDKPGDPSFAIVGLTIFAIGVLVAIRYHYQRRRHGIAVAMFVASAALAWIAGAFWIGIPLFGTAPTLAQEAWARDPSISHLRPGTRNRTVRESQYGGFGGLEPRMVTSIAAPVFIESLPANYTATPYTMAAQVRFADGSTVESARSSATNALVPANPGISTPSPTDFVSYEIWPTLMLARSDVFKRVGDRPGLYRATFDYTIERHDALGVMPLRIGAAWKDGARSLLVTDFSYRLNRCSVMFRTSAVSPITQWPLRLALVPKFQHHGRALRTSMTHGQFTAGNFGGIGLAGAFFLGSLHPTEQIGINYQVGQALYPIYDEQHATGPPCEEIDIAFERTAYAGSLTRTLELRDFYLNEPSRQTLSARQ